MLIKLMGIKFIDDFRYKIIIEETKKNQTHSQTSTVTKYNIRAKDGKLFQIIDTPGFGDTKGIKEDENITKKISDFFFYELQSINAVCLVINLIIDYQHAKNIYLIVSLIYSVKI